MLEIYDFDNAFLHLDSGRDFIFDLQLRPKCTVLTDRTTGKIEDRRSLITYSALDYIDFVIKEYDDSTNIHVFNSAFGVSELGNKDRCLVIIDDADILMTDEVNNYIRCHNGNHYLFMSRRPFGLDIPPSHIGELYDENGILKIHYKFDE